MLNEAQTTRHLAVLMTCFNRAERTRACLEALGREKLDWKIKVYLVDDGSTDDTALVASQYGFVEHIEGSGNLFWNKGMWTAWVRAERDQPDAYLWLNDDVILDNGALGMALAALDGDGPEGLGVLVGATRSSAGAVSYSGFRKEPGAFNFRLERLGANSEYQLCDTFNGNFVLIPKRVVERVGIIDPAYHHSFGDIDYGLRCGFAMVQSFVMPNTIGICEPNDLKQSKGWGSTQLSIRARWRLLNTHLGLPISSWWRFCRKHGGWAWPFVFARQYGYLLGFDRLKRLLSI
jgi:GT2 family glycosyltransferase